MTTAKSFSYHQQVARLRRAQELIRQAQAEIDACISHEREHRQEEGALAYEVLLGHVEHAHDCLHAFEGAVSVLAQQQLPDTVAEPVGCDVPGCTLTRAAHAAAAEDPHGFENDDRFQRMGGDVFDLAEQYSTTPQFVVDVLESMVGEGDQR